MKESWYSRRRVRRISRTALVFLLLAALGLFLSPDGMLINRLNIEVWLVMTPTPHLRSSVSPDDIGDLFNALAFIPLIACASLAMPRLKVWAWCLIGLGLSVLIEMTQLFFLIERKFDVRDIVFNTIGGIIGALVGAMVWRLATARDLNRQETASASNNPKR